MITSHRELGRLRVRRGRPCASGSRALDELDSGDRDPRLLRRSTPSSRASRAGATRRPRYVSRMRAIQRVLPEARFVHVIRDGRDVALSVARPHASRTPTVAAVAEPLAGEGRSRPAREQAPRLRPLPRGPLRGPGPRARGDAAADLRVHRAPLRRGDARLPRARRRAARGDEARAAGRGTARRSSRSSARMATHAKTTRAAGPRPRRALAPRHDRRGRRGRVRGRPPASCSPSSATPIGPGAVEEMEAKLAAVGSREGPDCGP